MANDIPQSAIDKLRKDLQAEMSKKIAGWALAGGVGVFALAALGAWTVMKPTIASELGVVPMAKIETIINTKMKSLAKIDDLEVLTRQVADLSGLVGQGEIPTGAVVAFDGSHFEKVRTDRLSSGCPAGWVRFVQAAGRFVLGSDSYPSVGETGKYELRKVGGAESHTLTVDEMPNHFHEEPLGSGTPGQGDAVGFSAPGVPNVLASTSKSTGGGQAHNNMPPYVVLYFCKRE